MIPLEESRNALTVCAHSLEHLQSETCPLWECGPQQKRGEYSMNRDATGTSQGAQHRYTEAPTRKDTYGRRVRPRLWVFMGTAIDT